MRKAAKKLAKNLSCVEGGKCGKKAKGLAGGKADAAKAAKAGSLAKDAKSAAASFRLDLGTCPCCSKRCPLAKPKCGKGRAVARKKRERSMGQVAA